MVAVTTKKKPALAKLTRPRLFEALPRKRLFRQLDVARKQTMTWISSPPGAGKTTLVASYLEARDAPLFWYQLDADDADPATFFSYLIELTAKLKRPKNVRLAYLTPEYLGDISRFARRFFRTLFSWFPEGGVLVLDNCHEVASPTFHQILVEATQETPEGSRIIAISRAQSPVELARLKANNQLAELRWEDIKLTEEECADILRRKGIDDDVRIAQIHRVVDGWAGGLVLLSDSLNHSADAAAINLTGKEAVFDYFAGQFFDRAPQKQREVLMKTALLPQVTPDVAIALTGEPDAAKMLDQLYRRQYFTDRRTEPQISYRYHDLFREFLLNRAENEFDITELSAIRLHAGRLLLTSGEVERAIELLCRGEHFEEAEAALLLRAPLLLGQGRWKTLLESIALFLNAQVKESASLLYWRGMAHMAADPAAARSDLEAALRLSARANDLIGQLNAIVGILTAHFVQDNSLAQYSRWVDPMATLFAQIEAWPNCATELEARSMFLLAGSHIRPDHPLLQFTATRVIELMEDKRIEPNTRRAAGLRALVYFMWAGESELARRVNEHLEALSVAGEALAAHISMGYAFRAYYQHIALADTPAALLSFERALAIARENGLTQPESLALQFQGVVSAAFAYDLDLAEGALRQIAKLGFDGNLNQESNYYGLQANVCKWRGDVAGALRNARRSVGAARANCPAFLIFVGIWNAHVFADAGEFEEEAYLLVELRGLIENSCFDNFGALLALEDAYLSLHRQDRVLCHQQLREGLSLAKTNPRHLSVLHFTGGPIPALFAEALASEIESDWVRDLIMRWNVPAPSNAPDNWPWPLRVQTLGRFRVKLHGKPIEFGRKAPRKTLALLKTLIAQGGTDVPEQALIDALWPDEDGDAAHGAYSMALSRLRKLLGDSDFLKQQGAKLSLDRRKCWVDAWAFERSASGVENSARNSSATDLEAALALYGGNFLQEDSDAPWAAVLRERLRSHFIRLVSDVAGELEKSGESVEAIKLYECGLDADNLAEAFYQGVMRCHASAGRHTEAVATYLKLKRLLSITLNLKPSATTERLYQSLRAS